MNLMPVIQWLENGCDPKEAAKELRMYQEGSYSPKAYVRDASQGWESKVGEELAAVERPEQRQTDNLLLKMIQHHFPSLPLSDEYTDWGKWLGFARAAWELGAEEERAGIIESIPGGSSVDPQWVCDMIRMRSNAGLAGRLETR